MEKLKYDVDITRFLTMRIKTVAKYFFEIETKEDIKQAITFAKEKNIKYALLGMGSNTIFLDPVYDGLVIRIGKSFSNIKSEGNILTSEAGTPMPKLSNEALKLELSGLEFASGIPGNVGGGIYMNAGAYDGDIGDYCKDIFIFDEKLEEQKIEAKDAKFGYRESIFQEKDWVILGASFVLKEDKKENIKEKMDTFRKARTEKQPLNMPSVGSIFKRPKGYYVGKLVRDSGLAGKRIGDAVVSEKHTGFILNCGNATTSDVLELIKYIQNTVKQNFGVDLEPEFCLIS